MSRPIDDNWHYIDDKVFYEIPYKKYRNYNAFINGEEEKCEQTLCLCEDCFRALLEILNNSVRAHDDWKKTSLEDL